MKNLILIFSFMAAVSVAFAQDNLTVKDGRRWLCTYSRGGLIVGTSYEEHLSGDTIIGGHLCLKLYRTCEANGENDALVGAVYEESHKVFLHDADKWILLYDFTLDKGDMAEVQYGGKVKVLDVDTIDVNGTLCKRMKMADVYGDIGSEEDSWGYWVEGIGSDRSFKESSGWNLVGSALYLLQCKDGETIVFTDEDFKKLPVTTDIRNDETPTDECTNVEICTLGGNMVYKGNGMPSLSRGFYVVKRNGTTYMVVVE